MDNIKSKGLTFRYQLLDRLRCDCEYFLNNPQVKHLWAGNIQEQIKTMKEIYRSFYFWKKPRWIKWKEILMYEKKMKQVKEYN